MISLLINYLLTQPSTSTAPLVLALQNSNLVTQLGGSGVEINLVNTRDYEGNPPFVRIYDSGIRTPEAAFLGGSYQEIQIMNIQCAAYGSTPTEASIRADYLKRAVRGIIQLQIDNFLVDLQSTASDLAGSNATDSIVNIYPVGGDGDPVVMGPGKDTDNPKWTALTNFKVQIRVFYSRARTS